MNPKADKEPGSMLLPANGAQDVVPFMSCAIEEDINETEPLRLKEENLSPLKMLVTEVKEEMKVEEHSFNFPSSNEEENRLSQADMSDETSTTCEAGVFDKESPGTTRPADLPYQCDICKNMYYYFSGLSNHMRTHTGEMDFKCDECGDKLLNRSALTNHMRKHMGEMPFKCDECNKSFAWRYHLNEHVLRVHIRTRLLKCDKCGRMFPRNNAFDTHKEWPFQCDECSKKFPVSLTSNVDQEEVMETDPLSLEKDGSLPEMVLVRSRMNPEADKEPGSMLFPANGAQDVVPFMSCAIEEDINETEPLRLKEENLSPLKMLVTEVKEEMKVEEHSFNFLSSNEEENRLSQADMSDETSTTCEAGVFDEESPGTTRPAELRYQCDICKNMYYYFSGLSNHMRTHTGEMDFKCDECGDKLLNRSALTNHMRKHMGEMPFKCDECNKSFAWRYHLNEHVLRVHIRTRLLKCDKCGRMFPRNNAFDTHKEWPFQCDECCKKFPVSLTSNVDQEEVMETDPLSLEKDGSLPEMVLVRSRMNPEADKEPGSMLFPANGAQDVVPFMSCAIEEDIKETEPLRLKEENLSPLKLLVTEVKEEMKVEEHSFNFPSSNEEENRLSQADMSDETSTTSEAGVFDEESPGTTRPAELRYQCDICSNMYYYMSGLSKHMRTHAGEMDFKCDECGDMLLNRSALINHMRKHMGEMPFKCDECNKTFAWRYHLNEHVLRVHIKSRLLKCEKCGRMFARNNAFDTRKEWPFQCDENCKKFPVTLTSNVDQEKVMETDPLSLEKHGSLPEMEEIDLKTEITIEENNIDFPVSTCEEKSRLAEALLSGTKNTTHHPVAAVAAAYDEVSWHFTKRPAERRYKCDLCSKMFCHLGGLANHVQKHKDEIPLQCGECGVIFSQRSYLKVHERSHANEKFFRCVECGKLLSGKQGLDCHMRTHTGERPFKCDECGKTFATESTLSGHMMTHTGEKHYKCNECDKMFSRTSNLKQHMTTHTEDKPFKCDLCDKMFRLKSHLTCHMKLHTGERSFKCNDCGKAFAHKVFLQSHMRMHAEGGPFKCDVCDKIFSKKSRLTDHIREHTGERPFKCVECDRGFTQRHYLREHMRVHTRARVCKCAECDKMFSLRTDTGERPLKCVECNSLNIS